MGMTPDLAARIFEADLLVEEMDREYDAAQRQVFGDDTRLRRDFDAAVARAASLRAGATPRTWRRGAWGLLLLAWAFVGLVGIFMGSSSWGFFGLVMVGLIGYYGYKLASDLLASAVPAIREPRVKEAQEREQQLRTELARRGLEAPPS
jgi:hypothetical protein